MKYSLKLALFIILSAFVSSCNTKQKSIDTSKNITPKATHSIIIYGSVNCEHCVDFRKSIDSLGVEYTFFDVEANEQYFTELQQKIQMANYPGYVSFPVLDIDGKLFVRPELNEFIEAISN